MTNDVAAETARLLDEITGLTGEDEDQALLNALRERRSRLAFRSAVRDGGNEFRRFLAAEADRTPWPSNARRLRTA